MSIWLNNALYGWYPYVALTVFLLGSLLRFDHSQYTWRSGSPAPGRRGSWQKTGDRLQVRPALREGSRGQSKAKPHQRSCLKTGACVRGRLQRPKSDSRLHPCRPARSRSALRLLDRKERYCAQVR